MPSSAEQSRAELKDMTWDQGVLSKAAAPPLVWLGVFVCGWSRRTIYDDLLQGEQAVLQLHKGCHRSIAG